MIAFAIIVRPSNERNALRIDLLLNFSVRIIEMWIAAKDYAYESDIFRILLLCAFFFRRGEGYAICMVEIYNIG